jgi:hypothetical protein
VKGHPCGEKPVATTAQLRAAGIAIEQPDGTYGSAQPIVTVAPRESGTLIVGFPSEEAYQIFCDFFSFQVTFLLDNRESVTATAITELTRATPRTP